MGILGSYPWEEGILAFGLSLLLTKKQGKGEARAPGMSRLLLLTAHQSSLHPSPSPTVKGPAKGSKLPQTPAS